MNRYILRHKNGKYLQFDSASWLFFFTENRHASHIFNEFVYKKLIAQPKRPIKIMFDEGEVEYPLKDFTIEYINIEKIGEDPLDPDIKELKELQRKLQNI